MNPRQLNFGSTRSSAIFTASTFLKASFKAPRLVSIAFAMHSIGVYDAVDNMTLDDRDPAITQAFNAMKGASRALQSRIDILNKNKGDRANVSLRALQTLFTTLLTIGDCDSQHYFSARLSHTDHDNPIDSYLNSL